MANIKAIAGTGKRLHILNLEARTPPSELWKLVSRNRDT